MSEKELLIHFMQYLERRGFIDQSLQYDTEHQADTYLGQFKPNNTDYII